MSITRSICASLFALVLLAISVTAFAQLSISVSFAPPELPTYEQPLLPGAGYIWTPGYWAYAGDDDGYYWVPGTWVMAPEPGLLWTPAYWGWSGNGYAFHQGYWGEQVGFYGGVSYGYGYYGEGYQGGRWQNGQFYYNRSASNVNVTTIRNVYNTTVVNNTTTVNRVSYNGGNGGITARPTSPQESAAHERHIPPVAAQAQHEQAARIDPQQRASQNHGTPSVAATPRPGAFSDRAVVRAKPTGTPYAAPVNRVAVPPPATRPGSNAVRSDRPHQPEADRTPAAQPNNRPEPNRNESPQRPIPPPSNERPQPERNPSPPQPRAQDQRQHAQPAPEKPAEKSREERPKQNEKPQ